jgi:Sec-independent protein translocase protein TatA
MFPTIGPMQMILMAGVCLLFFGIRLPGVMRSLDDRFRNGRGGGGPQLGV